MIDSNGTSSLLLFSTTPIIHNRHTKVPVIITVIILLDKINPIRHENRANNTAGSL
jgi:hypothetical protein